MSFKGYCRDGQYPRATLITHEQVNWICLNDSVRDRLPHGTLKVPDPALSVSDFDDKGLYTKIDWRSWPGWYDRGYHWRGFIPRGGVESERWNVHQSIPGTIPNTHRIDYTICRQRVEDVERLEKLITPAVTWLRITKIPQPQPPNNMAVQMDYATESLALQAAAFHSYQYHDRLGFFLWLLTVYEIDLTSSNAPSQYEQVIIDWYSVSNLPKTGYLVDLERDWQEFGFGFCVEHNVPVYYIWYSELAAIERFRRFSLEYLQPQDMDEKAEWEGNLKGPLSHWKDKKFDYYLQFKTKGSREGEVVSCGTRAGPMENWAVDFEGWSRRPIDKTAVKAWLSECELKTIEGNPKTTRLFLRYKPFDHRLPQGSASDMSDIPVIPTKVEREKYKFNYAPLPNERVDPIAAKRSFVPSQLNMGDVMQPASVAPAPYPTPVNNTIVTTVETSSSAATFTALSQWTAAPDDDIAPSVVRFPAEQEDTRLCTPTPSPGLDYISFGPENVPPSAPKEPEKDVDMVVDDINRSAGTSLQVPLEGPKSQAPSSSASSSWAPRGRQSASHSSYRSRVRPMPVLPRRDNTSSRHRDRIPHSAFTSSWQGGRNPGSSLVGSSSSGRGDNNTPQGSSSFRKRAASSSAVAQDSRPPASRTPAQASSSLAPSWVSALSGRYLTRPTRLTSVEHVCYGHSILVATVSNTYLEKGMFLFTDIPSAVRMRLWAMARRDLDMKTLLIWALERHVPFQIMVTTMDLHLFQRHISSADVIRTAMYYTPDYRMASVVWSQGGDGCAAYVSRVTELLHRPHVRAFRFQGGLTSRIADYFGGESLASVVLAGPSVAMVEHRNMQRDEAPFSSYVHEKVSHQDVRTLLGCFYTTNKGETVLRSLWPQESLFRSNFFAWGGEWNDDCEEWFRHRADQIRQGLAEPKTDNDWLASISTFSQRQHIEEASRPPSSHWFDADEALNHHISNGSSWSRRLLDDIRLPEL